MSSHLLQFALKKGQGSPPEINPKKDVNTIEQTRSSSLEEELNKRLEDELGFLPPEEISSMMAKVKEEPQNNNLGPTSNHGNAQTTPIQSAMNGIPNDNLANQSFLPLPPNLQMLNNGHFLDPTNQTAQTKPSTPPKSYFPNPPTPLPDSPPLSLEEEKVEYRGKSRYKQNPNGKTFDCKECGASLKSKPSLDLHIKSKHMHIKDFNCPFCDYKSAQKGAIGGHMACTHNKTEKFECNACNKLCDGKRDATHHAKEHKGNVKGFDNQFTSRIVTFIEA